MSPPEEGLPLEGEDVFLLARKSGPLSVRGACVACDEDNIPFFQERFVEKEKWVTKRAKNLEEKRW
jgi:hypothetical protein